MPATVTECVLARRSTRAFRKDSPSKETVLEILETARQSPSGGNVQPWFVDVLAAEALDGLRERVRAAITENPQGEGAEYELYPKGMAEPYRERRFRCGEGLYAAIGVPRDDKLGRMLQFARNFELFDAPVGLFFSIDRAFGPAQWAHLGMFMQTIMLLAQERGLGSCAQEAWMAFYKTVGDYLELPSERMLYCGMALGYADLDAPVNSFVTERAPLSDIAVLRGF